MLAEIAGKKAEPEHKPERPGDIRNSLADISLARKFLGYEPREKLLDGLTITFDWFRKTYGNAR